VLAARRLALLSADEGELALREEAKHLAPWRRRAVRALLARGERISPEALHLAAAIRDEELLPDGSPRRSRRAAIAAAVGIGAAGAAGVAAGSALRAPSAAVLAGAGAGALAWAAGALVELWVSRR
jgi:hypothetical protein